MDFVTKNLKWIGLGVVSAAAVVAAVVLKRNADTDAEYVIVEDGVASEGELSE